jgi:UDP-N-acetylglucosamine 4,6-dehydratase
LKNAQEKFSFLNGKTVLITGGAGSLGQALTRNILNNPIQALRILDSDENGLFEAKQKFIDNRMRFFLGDVRDLARLKRAVEGTHIIFHCAALKHVELGEINPFEVLKSNIIGTQNVIEAVLDEQNVEKFVFISTDKAVNPSNIYGVSKYFGERLTIAANNYKGDRPTVFGCIRLPNLKGSRGSVYEVWERQLKEGRPLSVTDERMERYFMDLDEGAKFVLKATAFMDKPAIIVPANVKKYKIIDLAKELSDKIEIVGARPGERIKERLLTPEERKIARRVKGMWIIE